MKLLYDHQIFTWQNYGGISRYFSELMNQFIPSPWVDFRLALRYSQNEHLHQNPRLNRFWTQRNDFFSGSQFFSALQKKIHINVLNHILNNQRESIKQLKGQDFDLFHPTYYDPYFLKHLGKKPYVLTIYDMIHEIFPDAFDKNDLTRNRKKTLADNAKQIIAISDNTKKDIVKYLDIPEDKIQVIYLADSLSQMKNAEFSYVPGSIRVPKHYLLYIGNRSGYKNFSFLIDGLFPVLKKNADLDIVCAGGGYFSNSEKKMIRNMNMVTRIHHYPADDATLQCLYKKAYAFIFPSLYEGFGIPVLEAFSFGCPAMLSSTSSLPEVGGDSALYFDPLDRTSLTNAVERILSNGTLRKNLIMKGFERSKLFSWEKTASMTKKVYEIASK
jgi:glycosyltransferase involved in cell wall biosynthesis